MPSFFKLMSYVTSGHVKSNKVSLLELFSTQNSQFRYQSVRERKIMHR